MDKKFIEDAYRKLKGSVYMDKTLPFLRKRIVDYERGEVEKKIEYIYENIHDENRWKEFKASILETIRVMTFPKQIENKNNNQGESETVVISNISGTDVIIEKYNNFIDMSVEGHIIGILWILTIGYKMDNNLYKNCYGNRLNNNLIFDNHNTTASPNLFKPYFNQYESWRNQGLKKAESIINDKNKSVIITMLDLTRYYYNITITEQSFKEMTSSFYDNDNELINRLNCCVYEVIKKYSELCGCEYEYMLPIGFHPSSIIANYYLNNIDVQMAQTEGAAYYGRYVDDMILVTEIKDGANFKEKVLSIGNKYVCDYMVELLKKANILNGNNKGEYLLQDFPRLHFQKSKFRFFYLDKDGNDTIIEKIKDDICENASEFNYIPETALEELDTNILKVEREDTVNKLRGINKTTIDKYTLSKAVGKNIMMSRFAEHKIVIKFAKNLEQILNHKEILSNYTLWESLLNYYVINDYTDGISNLSKSISSAIEHMEEDENKCGDYEYLKRLQIEKVGDSLLYYYFSCLTRATAISWGSDIKQAIEESVKAILSIKKYEKYKFLYTLKHINQTRKAYCNSRMINKNLLPVNIEDCMSAFKPIDLENKENIFSVKNYLNSNLKCKFRKNNQKFAPYIQSPFEILYSLLINEIRDGREQLYSDQECVKILCKKYAENFGNVDGIYIEKYIETSIYDNENYIVKIKSNKNYKNKKVRVAVANVRMEENDITDILEDNMRDLSERCREIGKILNEAIRYKTDILIFPEAYIPIEYLKILQTKVAAHNMIIIGGVEHIKHGDLVYNLTATILPIKNKHMSYSIPFFHQKLYFSPHELDILQNNNCKQAIGQKHTLFCYGGIYFATYCCYELTSISLRHTFGEIADIIFGVEWNKDTHYFGNVMEALSRDIYCYCVQANMSEYGDSRIIQPTKKDFMNILKVKGGINASVLIGEVDIRNLRKHQRKENDKNDLDIFKPLPAGWNLSKVKMKE